MISPLLALVFAIQTQTTAQTVDAKLCEQVANTYRREWLETKADLEAERKKKMPLAIEYPKAWQVVSIAVGTFGLGFGVGAWLKQ